MVRKSCNGPAKDFRNELCFCFSYYNRPNQCGLGLLLQYAAVTRVEEIQRFPSEMMVVSVESPQKT